MNTHGSQVTFTGTAIDICSQIRIDPSDDGLLVTTKNGLIQSANPTFCRWIGYKRNELLGMRLQQLLSREAKEFYQMYWQPLMILQGAVADVKLDVMCRSGLLLPMMSSAITCLRSSAIVHELTLYNPQKQNYVHKLLAARLLAEHCLAKNLKIQRELLSSRQSCGFEVPMERQAVLWHQMLGIVSHDLRTPLLAISMAAELLTRRPQAEKTVKLLKHINNSVGRAQRLVADLLDYTATQGGQAIAIHPAVGNLAEAVDSCLEELRLNYPNQSLLYEHFGKHSAMFDRDRLYQVIGNLVANAVAYGDTQLPVRITSSTAGSTATVKVHNQGPAIPPELLDRLFDPLKRGNHTSTKASNVGLGLFIVKQIAKAHAGDVSVVSSQEGGTSFSIRLCLPCTPLTFTKHISSGEGEVSHR